VNQFEKAHQCKGEGRLIRLTKDRKSFSYEGRCGDAGESKRKHVLRKGGDVLMQNMVRRRTGNRHGQLGIYAIALGTYGEVRFMGKLPDIGV